MFGVMFAPQPERVSAELARVCRPGGRIALANWPPDSLIGRQPYALRFPFPPTRAARAIGESIGPIRQGLAALDAAHRSDLQADIEALFVTENRATDGNTNIPSEYLDVRGRRK
jgi:hypothetical protein